MRSKQTTLISQAAAGAAMAVIALLCSASVVGAGGSDGATDRSRVDRIAVENPTASWVEPRQQWFVPFEAAAFDAAGGAVPMGYPRGASCEFARSGRVLETVRAWEPVGSGSSVTFLCQGGPPEAESVAINLWLLDEGRTLRNRVELRLERTNSSAVEHEVWFERWNADDVALDALAVSDIAVPEAAWFEPVSCVLTARVTGVYFLTATTHRSAGGLRVNCPFSQTFSPPGGFPVTANLRSIARDVAVEAEFYFVDDGVVHFGRGALHTESLDNFVGLVNQVSSRFTGGGWEVSVSTDAVMVPTCLRQKLTTVVEIRATRADGTITTWQQDETMVIGDVSKRFTKVFAVPADVVHVTATSRLVPYTDQHGRMWTQHARAVEQWVAPTATATVSVSVKAEEGATWTTLEFSAGSAPGAPAHAAWNTIVRYQVGGDWVEQNYTGASRTFTVPASVERVHFRTSVTWQDLTTGTIYSGVAHETWYRDVEP